MSERHTEPDARVERISSVVTCKNPPVCLLTQLSPVSTIALRLVPVPTREFQQLQSGAMPGPGDTQRWWSGPKTFIVAIISSS